MICFRPPADSPLLGQTFSSAADIAAGMVYLADSAMEEMHVVGLNNRNVVQGDYMVCRGWTSGCDIPAEEIIRAVMLMGLTRFVVVHNHPSSTTEFSDADIKYTEKLLDATSCSGLRLLDHVLVTTSGGVSMRGLKPWFKWG